MTARIYVIPTLTACDLDPSETVTEIMQNCACIIATEKGSCPLDREFGTDYSGLDGSTASAQMRWQVAIIEAIQQFEPRAQVKSVTFEQDSEAAADGLLHPIVTISIDEAYL